MRCERIAGRYLELESSTNGTRRYLRADHKQLPQLGLRGDLQALDEMTDVLRAKSTFTLKERTPMADDAGGIVLLTRVDYPSD